ncbi:MAG: T9SS type A sorting domain-containing protein [Bacteroidales bacterium]|nr:T9SS type A sorting domain-containing protein [Bacteroidales bacterium]
MKYIKSLVLIIFLLLLFSDIEAQNYTTLAEVVSAGGGASTGSNYSNFGVVGETFVNHCAAGEDYLTCIGFIYASSGLCVGIINVDNNQYIKIFPNPANVILNIESEGIESLVVEIFNINGKKVKSNEVKNSLLISDLPNGVYIVRIKGKNGKLLKTEKIVKN